MKTPRLVLVGLTVASLLGLSGTALASAPPTSQAGSAATSAHLAAAVRHATGVNPTHVRFLVFDHIIAAGGTMHIRGQVVGKLNGTTGALGGVAIKVYRQYNADGPWVYLGSQTIGNGAFPQFNFPAKALMNAHYKVAFAGDDTFGGSDNVTGLSVFRHFNAGITDGAGAAVLSGHVDPFYTHKPLSLQKRACATCSYITIKTVTTGVAGAYSFSLPAPPSGRWWWRVATPGTGAFVASWSGTFTTQLI